MENKKTNSIKKKLGIVAVMLVLVLAIGATAGTTLARYISSATVESQVATVAKFGFTFTASTDEMFGTNYGDELTPIGKYTYATVTEDGKLVANVDTETADNLVAPGTAGSMKISIKGSAQVATELVLDFGTDFSMVSLTGGIVDGTYYPIKWAAAVDNDELVYTKVTSNAASLAKIVAKAVNANEDLDEGVEAGYIGGKVYIKVPANVELDNSITIAWKWDFHVDDTTDIYDTILGYKAYGQLADDYAFSTDGTVDYTDLLDYKPSLKVSLKMVATIMQVQSYTTGVTVPSND